MDNSQFNPRDDISRLIEIQLNSSKSNSSSSQLSPNDSLISVNLQDSDSHNSIDPPSQLDKAESQQQRSKKDQYQTPLGDSIPEYADVYMDLVQNAGNTPYFDADDKDSKQEGSQSDQSPVRLHSSNELNHSSSSFSPLSVTNSREYINKSSSSNASSSNSASDNFRSKQPQFDNASVQIGSQIQQPYGSNNNNNNNNGNQNMRLSGQYNQQESKNQRSPRSTSSHRRSHSSASNISNESEGRKNHSKVDKEDVHTRLKQPKRASSNHPSIGQSYSHSRKSSISKSDSHRSASLQAGQNHQKRNSLNRESTSNTLDRIQIWIHLMRASSIFMLIVIASFSVFSWAAMVSVLTKSQANRSATACLKSPTPAAPVDRPPDDKCVYFNHDMTSFLVLTGLWSFGGILVAFLNIMASFAFYWRQLTRLAQFSNIIFCVLTFVSISWNIILVAFVYEDGNWRAYGQILNESNLLMRNVLTKTAFMFLFAAIFVWLSSMSFIYLVTQTRRFILEKPKYCCWPASQACLPMSRQELTKLAKYQRLANPVDRRLLDDDEDDEDDKFDHEPSKPDNLHSSNEDAFGTVIQSLGTIQNTMMALATKIETLEARNAAGQLYEPEDPFAYGRKVL